MMPVLEEEVFALHGLDFQTVTGQITMTTVGSTNDTACEEIENLIRCLSAQEGHTREKARMSLIRMGRKVVPFLMNALSHSNKLIRWEAAKALSSLRDPTAAPPLVEAMADENPEVTWMAAEALIALEHASIVPLLRGIERHFDSLSFRYGAYHVLHAFKREKMLNAETAKVFKALRSMQPDFSAASAAYQALRSLQNRRN